LPVAEQVQRLIVQATSHENLCQCYIGWCPVRVCVCNDVCQRVAEKSSASLSSGRARRAQKKKMLTMKFHELKQRNDFERIRRGW
jgi:hypothetical protein